MQYIIGVLFLFFEGITPVSAQNFPPPPPPLTDTAKDKNIIFSKVEVEATFPGGDAGWRKYLIQNLDVDKVSKKIKIPRGEKEFKETIIVKFIVSRDGSISNVKAENADANPYCIAEAERVIQISPKWISAQQNGRKVNAYRRQPITFLFER